MTTGKGGSDARWQSLSRPRRGLVLAFALALLGPGTAATAAARSRAPQDGGGDDQKEATEPQAGADQAAQEDQTAKKAPEDTAKAPADGAAAAKVAPETETASASAPEDRPILLPGTEIPVRGSLWTRYVGRFTGADDDHDLYTGLYADVGDEAKDPVTAHVHAYAAADLDSKNNGTFRSINDSYKSGITGRLYQAYADVHTVDDLSRLRIGRQQLFEPPALAWFDGVQVESQDLGKQRVRLGAYGGIPVHLFESSSSGDALYGLYANAHPFKGGHVRFDWLHLRDETVLGTAKDDLFGLGIWQRVSPALNVSGETTFLESDSRDYRLRGTWYDSDHDLTLSAGFYELLHTEERLPLEIDPFFRNLHTLFPYYQATLQASKGFEDFVLQGGYDLRRVRDDSDVGTYNRDYDRGYVEVTVPDIVVKGLDLDITGEAWTSSSSRIDTWGADLSKDLTERIDGRVGSYYSLYKYDLFADTERDNVRTYFVDLELDRTKDLSFDFRYELENDDVDTFHTVRLGLSWRF